MDSKLKSLLIITVFIGCITALIITLSFHNKTNDLHAKQNQPHPRHAALSIVTPPSTTLTPPSTAHLKLTPEPHSKPKPKPTPTLKTQKKAITKSQPSFLNTTQSVTTHQSLILKPIQWVKFTIKKGGSLALIFHKKGIPYNQLTALLKVKLVKKYLSVPQPGQIIFLATNNKKQLTYLKLPISSSVDLYVSHSKGSFSAYLQQKNLKSKTIFSTAIIKTSLELAAKSDGLNLQEQHQLTMIFQGSLNLKHDLKPGDQLNVIYDQYYINGNPDHNGPILLAQLITPQKKYTAIRFSYPKNHTGYYTLKGLGVEPLFLVSPLKYERISSRFSYARMDPYIKKIRPHYGVDYAAPSGTPIHSIGAGKISFCGKDHGYGNAVIIRYGKKYRGLYAHMLHFAHGIHTGLHVSKGQLIGYVGSTGWATGPHLHFGWYVNGIPKDPLKRHTMHSPAIPKSLLASYQKHAHLLLSELDHFQRS